MLTPPDGLGTVTREPDGFVIRVAYDRGAPHPERVFRAIDSIISALQDFDRTLLDSISTDIETSLVLDDVQAGSILIRLRNVLKTVDEDALAKADWKLVLGHYLRAGRNAFIEWVDDGERTGKKESFAALRTRFYDLAKQTGVKKMGDYAPVKARDIVDAAIRIDGALRQLAPRDRVTVESDDKVLDLLPGIDWTPELVADLTVKEMIQIPPSQMILIVKKPDYLSNAQWVFRYGRRRIEAKIEDEAWLKCFLAREIVIRPGDALRCTVACSVSYGVDNEPCSETHRILAVLDVVEDEAHRGPELADDSFFPDDAEPQVGRPAP